MLNIFSSRSLLQLFAGLALLALGACASYQLNSPQLSYDAVSGYRFGNFPTSARNTDSTFVILAFSGGGTRAAALSYGVLKKLRDTPIPDNKSLLDEVDVISSVSGGSFTAAYYGLFGNRIFTDFEATFLDRNIQTALLLQLLNPYNWARLASPWYSRIDLSAEYYDTHVFNHATYADLIRNSRRPYIICNASDMAIGAPFPFSQEQFDLLGSDLTDYPVARAVAASSAFPGLLTPITLKHFLMAPGFTEPEWVADALDDRDINGRRYQFAKDVRSYFDPARQYIHLMDGGIADNIGLRGPERSLASTDKLVSGSPQFRGKFHGLNLASMLGSGAIRHLAIVIVDAKPPLSEALNRQSTTPSLSADLHNVADVPMSNYSSETVEQIREMVATFTRERLTALKHDIPGYNFGSYEIDVDFDAIKDSNDQRACKQIPTTFSLNPTQVALLEKVGGQILAESNGYTQLLRALGSNRP